MKSNRKPIETFFIVDEGSGDFYTYKGGSRITDTLTFYYYVLRMYIFV